MPAYNIDALVSKYTCSDVNITHKYIDALVSKYHRSNMLSAGVVFIE
jgi:hypothetical protein